MPTFQLGGDGPKQLGPVIRTSKKTIAGSREVDVVFIIDTTGSMDDKIEALIHTCIHFVDEPAKYHLDPQFTLISFGDISYPRGGDRIEVVVPSTDNIEKIKHGLRHIPRNSGFGNDGESSFEAIKLALSQEYRPKAVKVLVHITDEPALFETYKPDQIMSMIAQKEVLFYAITPELSYFKEMANKNGGEWLQISVSSKLDHLKSLFARLASNVSKVSDDVHRLTAGNVGKYLQLKSGK